MTAPSVLAAAAAPPDYASGLLGGIILGGIGVGLTIPTLMSAAAASLPSYSFATGSAVVNMLRQTGVALGIAIVIAVLGKAAAGHGPHALDAFRRAWWVAAAITVAGIIPSLAVLHSRQQARLAASPSAGQGSPLPQPAVTPQERPS